MAAFVERLLLEVEARALHLGARFADGGLRTRDRLARGGEAALDVDGLALCSEQLGLRDDALRRERFEHRHLFAREAQAGLER